MRFVPCLGLLALMCCALAAPARAIDGAPNAASARPANLSAHDPSALCSAAIQAAQARYAIPPGLLGSIAKVESGRPIAALTDIRPWPWTIDADGTGMFFATKAEAVAWSQRAAQRGVRSLDTGCMQVNMQMHPGAFASLDAAFDPATNADYAARYLRELHAEANGDWNVAVGLYHSHTPYLAAEYRDRVAQMGAGIVSGIGGPEPLYQRAMRQGTLRLALAGGGVLLLNTGRQPTGRRPHRRSACQVAAILAPLLHSPPRMAGCRGAAGGGKAR
jgi:hypothetical protein